MVGRDGRGRFLGNPKTASAVLVFFLTLLSRSLSAQGNPDPESLAYPSILPILRDQWVIPDKEETEARLFALDRGLLPADAFIPLDLDKAIQLALGQNLDLRAESYTTRIAASEVDKARGVFDTYLVSNFAHNTVRAPISSQIQSEETSYLRTNTTMADIGLRKTVKTGSTVELKLDLNRYSSNSSWLLLNPSYVTHLNFSIAQPLLKNGGVVFQTAPLSIARNLQLMSEDRWRAFVAETLATVIQAYWDLVFTFQNFQVRRKSLEVARELLRTSEIRVRLGSLAPADILQSQTGVALREEELLKARNLLETAQDLIRNLLQLEESPLHSAVRIVPTEQPPRLPPEEKTNLEEAISRALKNRPEYRVLLKDLETKNLQIRIAANQMLPSLDVTGKIGLNGLGGSEVPQPELGAWEKLIYDLFNIPQPGDTQFGGGYQKSFDEMFSSDYYQYSVGLRFEMPLENTGAKAGYRKAKMDSFKTVWSLRNLEQKIILEVKEACRAMEISRQRIRTSDATQHLAQQQLEAEEKRLALGLSTNYQVLKMEEDFRNSQINSLMAGADYCKAKARLHKACGVLLEETGIPLNTLTSTGGN